MAALATHLAAALERIDARHERRRLSATTLEAQGRLTRGAARLVDFSSNDYLGLALHPLLAERSAEWAVRLGSGSGASRLVTGTHEAHLALEAKIAAFKGKEAALLFPSGWHLNAAVLAALLRAAPGTLLYEFTVDDPATFTRPWSAALPMTRSDEPIYEYACHEGNESMVGILRGARVEEKGAPNP